MVIYANCKKYKTKNGASFFSMSIVGDRILEANKKAVEQQDDDSINYTSTIEKEKFYNIRFVGGGCPQKEGVYKLSFNPEDSWVDVREEFKNKYILRIRNPLVEFHKEFKPFNDVAKTTADPVKSDDLPF